MAYYQNSLLHSTSKTRCYTAPLKSATARHLKTRYHMTPSKAQKAQFSLAILKSPIYIGTILKAQGY